MVGGQGGGGGGGNSACPITTMVEKRQRQQSLSVIVKGRGRYELTSPKAEVLVRSGFRIHEDPLR